MNIGLKKKLEYMKLQYEKCISSKVFKEPLFKINEYGMILDNIVKDMNNIMISKIQNEKLLVAKSCAKLDALSPLKTLARGFCIVENENCQIIKSKNDIKENDNINLKFKDGNRKAKIVG